MDVRQVDIASVAELRSWLASWLSQELKVPVEKIDPAAPFTRYGLDSVAAVSLAVELEDQLDREISPATLWQYTTIDALADHLVNPDNPPPAE